MIRRLVWAALLVSLLALAGCTVAAWGYDRAPELARLWAQRQMDLTTAQGEAMVQHLRELQSWQRRQQLPTAADTLRRWQGLIAQDLDAQTVCREWDTVRQWGDDLAEQAVPGLTDWARGLTDRQRQALAESQRESHQAFREAHADTPPGWGWRRAEASVEELPTVSGPRSLAQRLRTATTWYERLYGHLTPAQTDALQALLAQSGFNPRQILADRQRRSQDLQQALGAVALAPTVAQAQTVVRTWLQALQKPQPAEPPQATSRWVQGTCTQWATVHRLASPEQRGHAVRTLADYEALVRRLSQR